MAAATYAHLDNKYFREVVRLCFWFCDEDTLGSRGRNWVDHLIVFKLSRKSQEAADLLALIRETARLRVKYVKPVPTFDADSWLVEDIRRAGVEAVKSSYDVALKEGISPDNIPQARLYASYLTREKERLAAIENNLRKACNLLSHILQVPEKEIHLNELFSLQKELMYHYSGSLTQYFLEPWTIEQTLDFGAHCSRTVPILAKFSIGDADFLELLITVLYDKMIGERVSLENIDRLDQSAEILAKLGWQWLLEELLNEQKSLKKEEIEKLCSDDFLRFLKKFKADPACKEMLGNELKRRSESLLADQFLGVDDCLIIALSGEETLRKYITDKVQRWDKSPSHIIAEILAAASCDEYDCFAELWARHDISAYVAKPDGADSILIRIMNMDAFCPGRIHLRPKDFELLLKDTALVENLLPIRDKSNHTALHYAAYFGAKVFACLLKSIACTPELLLAQVGEGEGRRSIWDYIAKGDIGVESMDTMNALLQSPHCTPAVFNCVGSDGKSSLEIMSQPLSDNALKRMDVMMQHPNCHYELVFNYYCFHLSKFPDWRSYNPSWESTYLDEVCLRNLEIKRPLYLERKYQQTTQFARMASLLGRDGKLSLEIVNANLAQIADPIAQLELLDSLYYHATKYPELYRGGVLASFVDRSLGGDLWILQQAYFEAIKHYPATATAAAKVKMHITFSLRGALLDHNLGGVGGFKLRHQAKEVLQQKGIIPYDDRCGCQHYSLSGFKSVSF